MNRMTRTGLVCAVALLSTSAVMGFSRGAPANASGVPTDMAGRTCAACHRPDAANSDPRGRLTVLLDRAVAEGHGDRVAIISPDGAGGWRETTYRDLQRRADAWAHVLVADGLRTGHRVLLRGM